jgi:hypothetical protein
MTATRGKNKRGNSARKYPGELGKRRRWTPDQVLQAGLDRSVGRRPSVEEPDGLQDFLDNSEYYERGFDLLAKHFGIARSDPRGLRAAFDTEAFWFYLAMNLLQNHVEFFMPPSRGRGAPQTLQSRFPGLSEVVDRIEKGLMHEATVGEVFAILGKSLGHKCDPPGATVANQFYKWRKRKGGNSKK